METHGFYHNAAPLGRALASGRVYSRVGGHSLRSAPPLPRMRLQISTIDRNVIFGDTPHLYDAARRVATVFEKWENRF